MPIKVTCQCGQSFAAKDELAGKTVKCPKCTKPLRIPETGPRVGSPAAQQRPPAATAGVPKRTAGGNPPAPAPLGSPLPSTAAAPNLFDEAGLGPAVAGTAPCPGCTAPLPPSAVVCVKCGYNRRLGRRMETVRMAAAPLPGGHDATAQELLDRAARRMEEEQEEERNKTREGMPWWVYLLGVVSLVAFMIAMSFIPEGVGLIVAAIGLLIASLLLQFYAWVRGLIAAFLNHPLHGFGVFFGDILVTIVIVAMILLEVPFADSVARYIAAPVCWAGYMFAHWDTCGHWFNLFCVGILLRWAALILLLFAVIIFAKDLGDDVGYLLTPPHSEAAAVAEEELAARFGSTGKGARRSLCDESLTASPSLFGLA